MIFEKKLKKNIQEFKMVIAPRMKSGDLPLTW